MLTRIIYPYIRIVGFPCHTITLKVNHCGLNEKATATIDYPTQNTACTINQFLLGNVGVPPIANSVTTIHCTCGSKGPAATAKALIPDRWKVPACASILKVLACFTASLFSPVINCTLELFYGGDFVKVDAFLRFRILLLHRFSCS